MAEISTRLISLLKSGSQCIILFLIVIHFNYAQDLRPGEWFVRLIVQTPSNQLIDQGNVLGWLNNSSMGYDKHDLNELPPFGPDYLTIVFPHHNWEENSGDYASDFHQRKHWRQGDEWEFMVKSDVAREVTLSWEGYDGLRRMYRMRLVDMETGKIVYAMKNRTLQSYTFTMVGTTHRFKWIFLPRPA